MDTFIRAFSKTFNFTRYSLSVTQTFLFAFFNLRLISVLTSFHMISLFSRTVLSDIIGRHSEMYFSILNSV